MSTLTEILEVNWIILYFVYGLVFFATGLVTALQWRRQSSLELARPLPWLAAFGITHGLNEWGHIFVPLQALYLDGTVVRLMVITHLLLLAASYFFLFQFGVELLGETPSAETMLDLGLIVAEALASDEPASRIVMSVAPTVGDLGEVTYDVVGIGDDSVLGFRLHVFATPDEGGEGFVLKSVEQTVLCGRGLSGELCV